MSAHFVTPQDAAKEFGISPRQLVRFAEKHGITPKQFPRTSGNGGAPMKYFWTRGQLDELRKIRAK